MKIIRFLSQDNDIYYGQYDQTQPDRAKKIIGYIFSDYQVSQEAISIKKLLPPVLPPVILALGLNYRKHAEETNIDYPTEPILFLKAITSIIGPEEPILLPKAGPDEVDFEAELAIVIGRRGKNIPESSAKEYIFGYTCANDVSARDWQIRKQKKQWARGKSFDTFCPIGPWLVTASDLNPDSLRIRSILNGKTVQDSSTSDMIFSVAAIVGNLSQSMSLLPGTLILTGTPEGVGFTRKPPLFLRPGDRISINIEGIGALGNPVLKET